MAERRRTTFWHNCVMHPLCGLIWSTAPASRVGQWADAIHSRAHARMAPDRRDPYRALLEELATPSTAGAHGGDIHSPDCVGCRAHHALHATDQEREL